MREPALLRPAAVIALMAALTACGSSGSTDVSSALTVRPSVSVGVLPIVDVAPLYLGEKKGFFSKRGVTVTPKMAQTGAAIVSSVIERQYDFGFSNLVSMLMAREGFMPVQVVAVGCSSTGDPAKDVNAVLVGAGSKLRTAKDLEGKKVAINARSGIGDTTIKRAVEKAGGDPDSVTFVEVPFPKMPAMLAEGKVDAIWESEPFRTQVLDQGGRILFDNLTETYPRLQIAAYFTAEQMKTDNPATVKAFVAGINESMEYASAHPDEVRAVLTTYMKITPDVAARMVLPAWPTELDIESAKAVGDAALAYGILQRSPDAEGLFGQPG